MSSAKDAPTRRKEAISWWQKIAAKWNLNSHRSGTGGTLRYDKDKARSQGTSEEALASELAATI